MNMRAPFIFEMSIPVGAAATTATNAGTIIGEVPESSSVTEVAIFPNAAVTANTTNYRTWTVYNRGTNGTGTVAVAVLDTSVTGLTDNVKRTATLQTAASLLVPAGAILEVVETVASGGVAHGGYTIRTRASRT